jgi:hypothetical protein
MGVQFINYLKHAKIRVNLCFSNFNIKLFHIFEKL